MKIVDLRKAELPVTKDITKVGEVYTVSGPGAAHFRCQGGFVSMESGAYSSYEGCRADACWLHQPKAELHLNN